MTISRLASKKAGRVRRSLSIRESVCMSADIPAMSTAPMTAWSGGRRFNQ